MERNYLDIRPSVCVCVLIDYCWLTTVDYWPSFVCVCVTVNERFETTQTKILLFIVLLLAFLAFGLGVFWLLLTVVTLTNERTCHRKLSLSLLLSHSSSSSSSSVTVTQTNTGTRYLFYEYTTDGEVGSTWYHLSAYIHRTEPGMLSYMVWYMARVTPVTGHRSTSKWWCVSSHTRSSRQK